MNKIEPLVHEHGITEWLSDYKSMLTFFSAEDIEEAIVNSPYTDYTNYNITSTEYYEHPPQYLPQWERTLNNVPRVDRVSKLNTGTGRNETVEVKKWEYRIRSSYQGSINEYILRYCLVKHIPFFKDFKWSVYSIGYSDNFEIYLKTGYADDCWGNEMSLYVPVRALLDRDWKAIEKRNKDYWNQYCNPSPALWTGTDKTRQQYYDAMIEVLKTPAALELKKLLTSKKKV